MSLREVNATLRAAGHEARDDEADDVLPAVVAALALLKAHHEPFPLLVVDPVDEVRDLNRGAATLLGAVLAGPGLRRSCGRVRPARPG